MWAFFLLGGVLALDTQDCFAISCENFTSSNCLDVNTDSHLVSLLPCSGGCDYTSLYLVSTPFTNITCNLPAPPTGVTGSPCQLPSDCFSYICSVPVCYGANPGDYCPTDEGCQPQYYCDRVLYVCVPALNPGDSCTFDNQCPIGYGCNLGLCILYFSVAEGFPASENMFCKSNFAWNGLCDSVIVYNNDNQILAPFNCKVGETCVYMSFMTGGTIDTLPCECSGRYKKGGGYCSSYLEFANEVINDNYVYMTYTYSSCSGNYSHSDDPDILLMCGSITQDQRDFLFNMRGQARYWSLFQSGAINNCSVMYNIFNSTYLLSYYSSSLTLVAAFFVATAI